MRGFCTGAAPRRHVRGAARLACCLGLLALCGLASGCALNSRETACLISPYRPRNVYCYSPVLPAGIRRVAVLPLAASPETAGLKAGCAELRPILLSELIKTRKFDIVPVSPHLLRLRTGQADWTEAELLPADFFARLRQKYGCDAVLFCQLTVFRAYPPLAVGWRMRLVDARDCQTLWAADELFDAGKAAVQSGAVRYEWAHEENPADRGGTWLVQNSPREFAQYATARLLATLPRR